MSREALEDVCNQLGDDEIRALLFLARRLHAGQQLYGRIDLATDARDWRKERSEELADAAIYTAFDALRNGVAP